MKELQISEWLFKKIAKEHNAPMVWSDHIDCVYDETPKAYKVSMGACHHTVHTWIPKSQCKWVELDEDETYRGTGTEVFDNYEDAMYYIKYVRSLYC